jgi:hypothetical protein
MTETRTFHLGDLLSVSSGCLVSPRHIDGVYDILGFMTGRQLWTHELPRARDECRPSLLDQHPWLAAIDESSVNRETWRAWIDEQVSKYGEQHSVRPIGWNQLAEQSPIDTAVEAFGEDRVIVVEQPEEI